MLGQASESTPTPSQPQSQGDQQGQGDQSQTREGEQAGNNYLQQEGSEDKPKLSDLDLAKKFNYLTSQEKKLRERESQIKSEAEKYEQISMAIENLKTNPMEALKAAGWSFKDLAELILNDEQPTLEKKVQSLEEQIVQERKEREERARKEAEDRKAQEEKAQIEAYDKAVNKAKQDIKKLVDDTESYELIREQGAYDLVWDVVQEVFNETKRVIPFKEACDKVEEYLTQEVEKYFNVGKFKARYQPVPDKEEIEDNGQNYYMKRMLEEKFGKSLSNDMASEGSKPPSSYEQPYLSDDESKAKLAKKLREMLARQS